MPYRELELDVRRGDRRRAYLEAHVFELLIAALGVISALAFFLSPADLSHTAIGQTLHPFDYAWNALYLAGGGLITAGLVRPSYRLEVAGLAMFAGAIAGAAAAVVSVASPAVGLATITASLAVSIAAATACIVRILVIRRLERAIEEADTELERRYWCRRKGDA